MGEGTSRWVSYVMGRSRKYSGKEDPCFVFIFVHICALLLLLLLLLVDVVQYFCLSTKHVLRITVGCFL